MSLSGFAGGASDALTEVLKQKFLEMVQRKRLAQDDLRIQEDARQADLSADTQRRGQDITVRGQDHVQNRWNTERSDAQSAAQKAEADKAAQGAALEQFITGLPAHMRPVVAGKAKFGVQMSPEDLVEAPQTRDQAAKFRLRGIMDETEAREKIQAKYRPAPQARDERIVQIEGPNGTPIWVRESEAVGKPAAQAARAVTGAERQVIAYFNRAKEADELANQFEKGVAEAGLGSQLQQQFAPNILQTGDQQSYRQAQRAFTEARLRKESGAAIPQGEYDTDARTYFAQPGDTPQVREQKRRARQTVLEGLKFAAGRAYDEFYGESAKGKPKGADADPLGIRGGSK